MSAMRELPLSLKKSLDDTRVDYVKLGSSGLRVSWPILGAMAFGSPQLAPWVLGKEEAFKVLKAAYDCGINTWDTATSYSNGMSEEIIGEALRKFEIPRHKVVIMTKIYFASSEDVSVIGPLFAEQMGRSRDYVNQGGNPSPDKESH